MINDRRSFLKTAAAAAGVAVLKPTLSLAEQTKNSTFALEEMSIADMQKGLASGQFTPRKLAENYLTRIDAIDKRGPAIHSVIEINPDALRIADALDKERKSGRVRGPLHGIPI